MPRTSRQVELDAYDESRRIARAVNDATQALKNLNGILYHQVSRYGSDYIDFLRTVDAGVYSLADINDRIAHMQELLAQTERLTDHHLEPGSLYQPQRITFPTRDQYRPPAEAIAVTSRSAD